MYLTSEEIDRALTLPPEVVMALKAHAANSPGWYIRHKDKSTSLHESLTAVSSAVSGVWLPVASEDCILAAIRYVHAERSRPAEWAAMVDIRSLPVFSNTGVSMGVRWLAGVSIAKAHQAGEGATARLATLDYLHRHIGRRDERS